MNKINWIARILAATILLQTLFFKFTAAPESVYIFTQMGVEPFGRIASGVFELFAGILLVVPATQIFGALLALGIMAGAILSHLFVLGIVVQDDGGSLFGLAILVFCSSLFVLYYNRYSIQQLLRKFVKV